MRAKETIKPPAKLNWFKAGSWAMGYLAICTALSVLPLMATFKLFHALVRADVPRIEAKQTAELIVLLAVAGIFLSGLFLAWRIHRSGKLCLIIMALAYPAIILAYIGFVLLSMRGGGRVQAAPGSHAVCNARHCSDGRAEEPHGHLTKRRLAVVIDHLL
jgi:hypothetical protein